MYDIYLLPPGEDPETCQSWLRMRNKDGRYDLRFEEWVVDGPFVISPRISFEVCHTPLRNRGIRELMLRRILFAVLNICGHLLCITHSCKNRREQAGCYSLRSFSDIPSP